VAHWAIWAICAASIAGVLLRPRNVPEWVWALGGALALVVLQLLPVRAAVAAAAKGVDVYLFLAGMMLLAELARRESVFDWIAVHAVRAAHGSRMRLFALVYGVGVVVTALLSNDATAVVLTPAVAAAVRAANVDAPLPYLYACALVANAASFVLPISNPANLVIYAGTMPPLGRWLAAFALPSLASIAATYVALALVSRRDLQGGLASDIARRPLERGGRVALAGIGVTAVALIVASSRGAKLGLVTFVCGALVFAIVTLFDRAAFAAVVRGVSWDVLVLVAGLFVLVAGVEVTGALEAARHAVSGLGQMNVWGAAARIAGATALASNLTNNLPAGLLAGASVSHLRGHDVLRNATALGIDLGPNLSVTGSLATVLWLIALRREKIVVSAFAFLRVGVVVMPPALALAVVALCLVAR